MDAHTKIIKFLFVLNKHFLQTLTKAGTFLLYLRLIFEM
jgi:hypothetical protein